MPSIRQQMLDCSVDQNTGSTLLHNMEIYEQHMSAPNPSSSHGHASSGPGGGAGTSETTSPAVSTAPAVDTLSSASADSDHGSSCSEVECPKEQFYLWNSSYMKWHHCLVSISPPCINVQEIEDTRQEVNGRQLLHLQQKWFHGSLTRREARIILQDYGGGNGSFLVRTSESYHGKFAISFIHETKVKHIVVDSQCDPVAGVLYCITANGPHFDSLFDLIETAQNKPLIQNQSFNVVLKSSPPKPDHSWLHRNVKSLSQAEQILAKEHREGVFFVYRTQSDLAPYILAYRYKGDTKHSLIMATTRPSSGYTLNGVVAPVLYKLINYYMENPIEGDVVLKYPVKDKDTTDCGYATQPYSGGAERNEMSFNTGAFVTGITTTEKGWCCGDHRGDRQKFFPQKCVKMLTRDELAYINELKSQPVSERLLKISPVRSLNLQRDYEVKLDQDETSTYIIFESLNSLKEKHSLKLSCQSLEDLDDWYQRLRKMNSYSKFMEQSHQTHIRTATYKKRKSCVIC